MLSRQLDIQQHAQFQLGGRLAMTAAFATATDVAASLAGQQVFAAAAKSQVRLVAHALIAVAHKHTVDIL